MDVMLSRFHTIPAALAESIVAGKSSFHSTGCFFTRESLAPLLKLKADDRSEQDLSEVLEGKQLIVRYGGKEQCGVVTAIWTEHIEQTLLIHGTVEPCGPAADLFLNARPCHSGFFTLQASFKMLSYQLRTFEKLIDLDYTPPLSVEETGL